MIGAERLTDSNTPVGGTIACAECVSLGFAPLKDREQVLTTTFYRLLLPRPVVEMILCERHLQELARSADMKPDPRRLPIEYPRDPEPPAPIPMRLICEGCGELHIDEAEFATKPHHTHSCQHCGMTWRPAVVSTVGVRFLPGFKNAEPAPNLVFEVTTKPGSGEDLLTMCARKIRFLIRDYPDDKEARAIVAEIESLKEKRHG